MMSFRSLIGLTAVLAVTSCSISSEGGSYLVVVADRDDRQARIAMMSAMVAVSKEMQARPERVTSYDMRNDVLCVESDNLASLRGIVLGSLPSGARTELHERPGQSCNEAVPNVTGRKWKELELVPLG
jgi:hypothetical protein